MSESALYAEILAAHSRGDTRLFRFQSALAWQGTVVERTQHRLVLLNPRPIRSGVPGMSDLIGWTAAEVPGDGSGPVVTARGIFTAIECKSARGRLTDEQSAFLELVRRSGGRAGVARSVEDAGLILRGEI